MARLPTIWTTRSNDCFEEGQRKFEQSVPPLSQSNPALFAGLQAARRKNEFEAQVTVRFLADEDSDVAIIKGLRSRESAIDVLDVKAAGLRGTRDPVLLEVAAQQGRIMVSHDRKTMTGYFRELSIQVC